MIDPVTEKIWSVREQLIRQAGGFEAYFEELVKLDRKRLVADAEKKKARRAIAGAKKRSTLAAKKSKVGLTRLSGT